MEEDASRGVGVDDSKRTGGNAPVEQGRDQLRGIAVGRGTRVGSMEQQVVERAEGQLEVDVPTDLVVEQLPPVDGLGATEPFDEPDAVVGHHVIPCRVEQCGPRWEVAVEVPLGRPGRSGDLLDRALGAVLAQLRDGGGQELGPARFGAEPPTRRAEARVRSGRHTRRGREGTRSAIRGPVRRCA